MPIPALRAVDRQKLDPRDDALVDAQPRFVHHLDGPFRARLTALLRARIPAEAVLDLMILWVSHLPTTSAIER